MDNEEAVLTERIADALWQVWRGWRMLSHPVKQGKITPEQYWILHVLHRFGPQRIKDLAARMGTGSSAVTIAIKRLERDGLVCRQRGTADERVVTARLTDQGRTVFQAWRRERRVALSALFEPLDGDEKRRLYETLSKVLDRLEEGGVPVESHCQG
ncbi:MarR family winged helix-turn-helix transcriptional regulator [Desulfotomaculum copahuensis]|uniref:MarR family winged helix-turn-helix transcriptional regulator n=1 Tax=Desulfotomaculum copahuensis TaxID=1838280 RepID=UPI000AE83795|nr:MarR family transcriptional regulator [Desulfotomaculum copahuensis]